MILIDTGPLVAILDHNDPNHARCVAVAQGLPAEPMVTTMACLTEAMYFTGRDRGPAGQARLWQLHLSGKLIVHPHSNAELGRMKELMDIYTDTPMDFADASLVVAAEVLGISQIFSLDSHFHAYRLHGKTPFNVAP